MFLTCGEALFDMFVHDNAEDEHAVELDGRIGGSPLNVALGLARMGNDTRYFTHLSKDMFGQRIRAFLRANGINDELCATSERNSTLAMILRQDDGSAAYSFYTHGTSDCSLTEQDLPATLDPAIEVLHFGSFSTVIEPTGTALLALAEREADKRFISYDPNVRAMVIPDLDLWRDRIDRMLPLCGFVKASDEDVERLYPNQPLEAFCQKGLEAGADLVCVTRGPEGAIIASADGRLAHIDGISVNVMDTVGAGDTFQAACLQFLGSEGLAKRGAAQDVDILALGEFAVKAAAVTCSRRGADLPSLADIEAFFK